MSSNHTRKLFFAVMLIVGLFSFSHQSYAATISFSQIGAAATKIAPDIVSVVAAPDGFILKSALQALEGQVTPDGLAVTSLAKGGGGFSIKALDIGRQSTSTSLAAGAVSLKRRVVSLDHGGRLTEEFSASGDGINQDFIVPAEPTGTGDLLIHENFTGADVSSVSPDKIKVTLGSGRALMYDGLSVTDASGNILPAHMSLLGSSTIEISVDDASAVYPIHIDPTLADANWQGIGGAYMGVNGDVNATAFSTSTNTLYIGGAFTSVAGIVVNHIAEWNGSTWSALGSGMNGVVNSLAVDHSGNLYVGGQFSTANGISANHIAEWNGSAWSTLGVGMNNYIAALALDPSGNLYAGGQFTTASGTPANMIAKWNGSAWSALGTGISGGGNPSVYVLAIDPSGNVYVGGTFTTAGGISSTDIAKWNGSTWSALGSGMSGTGSPGVYALTIDSANNVYVGGSFTTASTTSANDIAKWNSTAKTWSALGSGTDNIISTLAIDPWGFLYAGGNFSTAGGTPVNHIAEWNATTTTWGALGTGTNGTVEAMSIDSSGNVYVGGSFTTANGASAPHIAEWNGSTWSALSPGALPTNGPVQALAVDLSGNLYAGGSFTTIDGSSINYIAKWNGSAWSAVGSGMNDYVTALAVDPWGNLYAGGNFTNAGGTSASHIAEWSATTTTWSAVGTGVNSLVNALAIDPSGNVYAGGIFTTAGGAPANYVAKWTATSTAWSALGSGMNNEVNALAVDPSGNLYAGGTFTNAGGSLANDIAKWNGSTWSALGSGISNNVYALAVDPSGNLYAGGIFTSAGGTSANDIAKWNGSTWSALGLGINGPVNALALDSAGNLFAGGEFTSAGTSTASHVAAWSTTTATWGTLGSGTNDTVESIALNRTSSPYDLYVGGDFTIAGQGMASSAAKYPYYTFLYVADGYISGAASQIVGPGVSGASVTAVPSPGYEFVDWSDGSTANPRTDTAAAGNISVTANFDLIPVAPAAVHIYSGGGGGGGGGSTASASSVSTQVSSAALTSPATPAVVASPSVAASPVAPASSASFQNDLAVGQSSQEVRDLQVLLNTIGFTVASASAGSPGNETDYFGPATQAALSKFQKTFGVSPAVGYFGPQTRALTTQIEQLVQLLQKLQIIQTQ